MTPARLTRFALAAALTLAACGGDESNAAELQGVWLAEAYGSVLEVREDEVRSYELTSAHCLLADVDGPFDAAYVALGEGGTTLRERIARHGAMQQGPLHRRIDALPERCAEGQRLPLAGEAGYARDARADFELVVDTFRELYVGFEPRGVDWDAHAAEVRATLSDAPTDEEMLLALLALIEPLEDSHVAIAAGDDEYGYYRGPTLVERLTDAWVSENGPITNDAAYAAYVEATGAALAEIAALRESYAAGPVGRDRSGTMKWFRTADDLGVLLVDGMSGYGGSEDLEADLDAVEAALEDAFAALAGVRGMVVDVRSNGGGYDAVSQLIARRFLDRERMLYTKEARLGDGFDARDEIRLAPTANAFTGPVVVLTSRATVSAAEVFTMMMRELPHVTLVGEATQGALSDVLSRTLPGGFGFDLANEAYRTPSGEWFEGPGIPPDVVAEHGIDRSHDAGLERALARLAGG
ncbi:MAG: S41 family peptidase [Myxococcota bacterium]